ncbi:ABC transporter ATP-binding protein [Pseudemcibacter aquimaris]|uniref:ABC transporter ATP-binding protein n=1 Tax=Pseudemcibacter aquimaris TaxID=2857064 RepID=UPI0020114B92|nr:ABC transporter ATP-binding protein [Pseudemcibacter aquimaris]MCC3862139.1 ABC transporter ATP-binding protein [Pseudemcibacter aquimaris]WDU58892.1 ABC transporter ATP-binding protein [Pseudemcibacter aquimaris]
MTNYISATGLTKSYGDFKALDEVNLNIAKGQIVGLIGSNGAGKTTLINSILGLASFEGELDVIGYDPHTERDQLMKEVCFISDVATLPKWIKVSEVLQFVEGIHPKFDREKALGFLKETSIPMDKTVGKLSKGMVVQLHLALIMAIDAKVLVLDEPTLGLDILYRKRFYDQLLEDYFDEERTIIITTHQVDEIENILTDVIFIREGRIMYDASMEDTLSTWKVLEPKPDVIDEVRALSPFRENKSLGRVSFIFNDKDRETLSAFGDVRRLSLSDLFVTLMTGE